jgi:hypothetical protein
MADPSKPSPPSDIRLLKAEARNAVDTALPGARSGYADVVGKGDRTAVDRALNAASDATGTATVAAALTTAAGIETGPIDGVPAIVTAGAAVANFGVNVAKAGLKVTGLSGKDQDGGYIYNGAAYVGESTAILGDAAMMGYNALKAGAAGRFGTGSN